VENSAEVENTVEAQNTVAEAESIVVVGNIAVPLHSMSGHSQLACEDPEADVLNPAANRLDTAAASAGSRELRREKAGLAVV
jgi:hypothetical protein